MKELFRVGLVICGMLFGWVIIGTLLMMAMPWLWVAIDWSIKMAEKAAR